MVPNTYTLTSTSVEIDSSLGSSAAASITGFNVTISSIGGISSKNVTLSLKNSIQNPISSPSTAWAV